MEFNRINRNIIIIITSIIGLIAFIYALYQMSIIFQEHFFPYLISMFIFLLSQELIKIIHKM